MKTLLKNYFDKLHTPQKNSHKGQNGRLLIIGGSRLFHAASLWSLEVASRIVDLVHYSSVQENNQIVQKLKEEFRNGIIVPREEIDNYIKEDDCILIGPGMNRAESPEITNYKLQITNLADFEKLKDEGIQTYYLTKYLLKKYPNKRWVIDAGALQMLELEWIPEEAILTPHMGEFATLKLKIKNEKLKMTIQNAKLEDQVRMFAKEYKCVILLKGIEDILSDGEKIELVSGGNAGMTKGGTGDVLAGLAAALYCKNDPFISAVCASSINKKAGELMYKKAGFYYNASDLAGQIPVVMKDIK